MFTGLYPLQHATILLLKKKVKFGNPENGRERNKASFIEIYKKKSELKKNSALQLTFIRASSIWRDKFTCRWRRIRVPGQLNPVA